MLKEKLSARILSWKMLLTKEGNLGQRRNHSNCLKKEVPSFPKFLDKTALVDDIGQFDSLFVKLSPFEHLFHCHLSFWY